jgi:cell division protein FtsB
VDRIIETYRQIAAWVQRSRRLLATAAVGVLGLMLGFHIAFGQNGMISYMHKREESRKLEQQINELQQENARVSKEIESLKTDPKTIEREAREQLRYARPGEVIYTLPQSPNANTTPIEAHK